MCSSKPPIKPHAVCLFCSFAPYSTSPKTIAFVFYSYLSFTYPLSMPCTCKQWKVQYAQCGHIVQHPHHKTRYCPAARRRQQATGARRPSLCPGGPAERSILAQAGSCRSQICQQRARQQLCQALVLARNNHWECCRCRERGGFNISCINCRHDICHNCRAATATPTTPSTRDSRATSHSGSRR